MRTVKMIRVQSKTIILECPKHGIPYKLESSGDPINEGSWKHYYCKKCRQERMRGKDGTTAAFK